MENKTYYYDEEYYSLEEICEKYQNLAMDQKKSFRDALAHFTLLEILKKCNYDERIIDSVYELAKTEASIIDLYGSFCGTVILAIKGGYNSNLRKFINLSGKLALKDDVRIDEFKSGEELLDNLISHTIGSYDKNIIGELSLVDYESLSKEECLAIANNFTRFMKNEELVSYDRGMVYKKITERMLK